MKQAPSPPKGEPKHSGEKTASAANNLIEIYFNKAITIVMGCHSDV